ncbi:MAG: FG-GAP repeat protein [Planctomycetota bacterium]|jgi:hypothetical protein
MYVSHVPPKLSGLISAIILLPAAHPAQAQVCQLYERQKLTAPDADYLDNFGTVSTDGNRGIVGARLNDDACGGYPACDSGSAYVFRRDDSGTPLDF